MAIQNIRRYLLFAGLIIVMLSCEKSDETYSSEKLVLKSQEIEAFLYDQYNGIENYTLILPVKLYARGGSPDHSSGDYMFKMAQGCELPEGLVLDTVNGILSGGGQLKELKDYSTFEIEVSDGFNTAKARYTVVINDLTKKYLNKVPVMQFSAPETNLICDVNSCCYGVSLSMLGGSPPYTFSLHEGDALPGGLTLNPDNGVISGNASDIKPGLYSFRISCTDSKGNRALSMCTAGRFEEYTLIVR